MIRVLVYEALLLLVVSVALLFVAWKNRGIKEFLWFFVGITLVTLSRVQVFLGPEKMVPLFYVTTALGYFILAISVIKLSRYIRSVKVLEHTAFYDSLTKAYTRNFIEEYINEEIKKAKRLKEKFCILLLDLNDFKQVNDRYGHNSGDVVLRMVADELRKNLRDYDMIARWGGDEFLVLLPAEEETNALEVAGRLVSNFVVSYRDLGITLSVGYACFPMDGTDLQRLVEVADNRMYKSKSVFKEARKHAMDNKGQKKV